MVDKTFNEQPMLVVVSDALDPRIKRQLQSQLQSEMMTIAQLDAELKNQESIQAIKQQYDSKKDESEFDENEVKESANAKPIEQNAEESSGSNDAAGGEDPFTGGSDDSGAEAAPDQGNQQGSTNTPAQAQGSGQDVQGNGESNTDAFSAAGAGSENGQGEQGGQNQPAQANQSQQSGDEDPFSGDSGQAQAQEAPEQNQQTQNDQSTNTEQQPNQGSNDNSANDAGGDDPFSDDVKFEAFDGIFDTTRLRFEDAAKQTDAEKDSHPPLKQLVYIPASDRGVDNRTQGVVAALEDPQNVVAVIDLTDVAEAEAKMQFASVKKTLQERGVTVVDTVDQAVDYLNEVYDQISGKAE